jgi:ABC-2 type transport system permease protein
MSSPSPPAWLPPRRFGAVNWRGVWALYRREVLRYLRFAAEGLGGSLVASLLLVAVFSLALPADVEMQPGVAALPFLAPGIAAYAAFINAFENGAFPVLYDKLEGMIGDIVMAPMTAGEIVGGYVLAAASGGLITGVAVLAAMAVFIELPLALLWQVAGFAVLGTVMFALAGFLTGLWALKWDKYSAIETFLMMPLGLLSGTFFTIDSLPELGQQLLRVNPVFYAIDGFRAGFTGIATASVGWGVVVLTLMIGLLWVLAWRLIAKGYRVKA